MFKMALRGYAKILLRDGGSINKEQAEAVQAKFGVFPSIRGIRKQNEAKRNGINEWPTKATQLSLEGVAAKFDAAKAMVMEFVAKNGQYGAEKPAASSNFDKQF